MTKSLCFSLASGLFLLALVPCAAQAANAYLADINHDGTTSQSGRNVRLAQSESAPLTYQGHKAGVPISDTTSSAPATRSVTAVFPAASCSAADVQQALNNATDGSIVTIPAGTCYWGSASVSRAAGVHIRGAGQGATIIKRDNPVTAAENYMVNIDCSNGKKIEISSIKFTGNDGFQNEEQRLADYDNGVLLAGNCLDFEVHDVGFAEFSVAGLTIKGINARGVVYDSNFLANYKCQPDPEDCYGYGVAIYGDPLAAVPSLALGSQNAVFVEDSFFYDNRHAIASNHNSRYVFRHNTVYTTERTRNFGMIDAHGYDSGNNRPGSRSWEVYENFLELEWPLESSDGIYFRGGDGVVFNNTINTEAYIVRLTDESGCTSGTYPLPGQVRSAYIWNNTGGGTVVDVPSSCTSFIQQNRDYFLYPRPNYTPYTYPHPLR